MAVCPKCGSEVTKAFCTKCGTRLPAAETGREAVTEAPKAEVRPEPEAKPEREAAPKISKLEIRPAKTEKPGKTPEAEPKRPEKPKKPKKPRSKAAVAGAILLIINTLIVLITAGMAYAPENLQSLIDINSAESAVIKTAIEGCLPYVLMLDGLYLVISLICLFTSFVMRKSKAASRLMLIHLPIMIAATAVLVYTPVSVLGLTGIANRTIMAILAAGSSKALFTASVIFLTGWWSGFVLWIASYLLLKLGGANEKKLVKKAEKAEKAGKSK